jgi:UDP-N-acetylmuramoyl-tripeptide--D-alanyl-D-alanine ligase
LTVAALRLDAIAAATGGELLAGDPGRVVDSYDIDTRRLRPGALFFALTGARDGHDFLPDAAARGAAGAVVSRTVPSPAPGFALVRVADTLRALQVLAHGVLAARPRKVVGITGSTGKTTTKEFVAALLAARYRVLKSEGNFNNRLGLPLSLLRLEPDDEVAVLEMGMSAPGEIRELVGIAPPDVALITNVHPVHLAFFPDLRAVGRAKREILEGTRPDGTAVLNGDDPLVAELAAGWRGRRVDFGFGPACEVRAEGLRRRDYAGAAFRLRYGSAAADMELPFLYDSAVLNFLAAAGAALALDVPLANVLARVPALVAPGMRGVFTELAGGVRFLDDSYNSNPKALEMALRSLAGLPAPRKIAVLGDMLELGPGEADFHREAGRLVKRLGWDILVAIGPLARHMADGAAAEGLAAGAIFVFQDAAAAAEAVPALVRDGDLVLVKGSRGVGTERVVARLKAERKE